MEMRLVVAQHGANDKGQFAGYGSYSGIVIRSLGAFRLSNKEVGRRPTPNRLFAKADENFSDGDA